MRYILQWYSLITILGRHSDSEVFVVVTFFVLGLGIVDHIDVNLVKNKTRDIAKRKSLKLGEKSYNTDGI